MGKGGQMGGRDVTEIVLDQVQVLDQQVAAPWPVAEQRLDRRESVLDELPAPWGEAGPCPGPPPDDGACEPRRWFPSC